MTHHLRGRGQGVGWRSPGEDWPFVKWANAHDTIHLAGDNHNNKAWEVRGRESEAEVPMIITGHMEVRGRTWPQGVTSNDCKLLLLAIPHGFGYILYNHTCPKVVQVHQLKASDLVTANYPTFYIQYQQMM